MFESNIIPTKEALEVRSSFIDRYVDTSNINYVKYIKPLKATDVLYGYGIRVSYLFDNLKTGSFCTVGFNKAIELLRTLGNKQVFIMFDIRPQEHICPDSCTYVPYPYTKHFSSDSVLKMNSDKVIEVLLKDQSLPCDQQIFGEDLYIIEESVNGFFAFSHTEMSSGENACFISRNIFDNQD